MVNMNHKMKNILSKKSLDMDAEPIKKMCNNILLKTRILKSHNCIIYDEKSNIKDSELNWDFIVRTHSDLTGFEVSCNEISLKNYIDYSQSQNGAIIYNTLEYFSNYIKDKYSNKSFCIVIYESSGDLFLRFHVYRKDEGLWIDKNIEKYVEPILYKIF